MEPLEQELEPQLEGGNETETLEASSPPHIPITWTSSVVGRYVNSQQLDISLQSFIIILSFFFSPFSPFTHEFSCFDVHPESLRHRFSTGV